MTSPAPSQNAITHDDIHRVVKSFYAKARAHDELGPVFFNHIGRNDLVWDAHEAKIEAFWRGAILREPGFSGSPMGAHMRANDVQPEHFEKWLGLFDLTLKEELTPDLAAAWSDLAHRIGEALRMGVVDARRKTDEVPRFF